MTATVHADPVQVLNRLSLLGLEEEPLRIAVARGGRAVDVCTANHPRMFPPIAGWAETVCALREYGAILGWSNCDDSNYSICISPDSECAIAVATGNEATGIVSAMPATRAAKGRITLEAVLVNQANLDLFPDEKKGAEDQAQRRHENKRANWILLVHRAGNEIRAELSQPVSIGEDGRVNNWRERIILGSIPLDPAPVTVSQPPQPNLDVQIRRRA
jgi:hypothetical protein